MSRVITVAAAQLGAIQLATPRQEVLDRLLRLMDDAAAQGVRLLVYPELALTTFFPRHIITDRAAIDAFFEEETPETPEALRTSNPHTKPIFDRAHHHGMDVSLGYGEKWTTAEGSTYYNTMCYYSAASDSVIAKYRKVHLPGTPQPTGGPQEQLEKMFFSPGDFGFEAFRAPGLLSADCPSPILGMLLCNDRRWPEGWRCYGLQGVEIVLEGYNTTAYYPARPAPPAEQEALSVFHHTLSCQAGSYHNACFGIHAGKAGNEDGGLLIANSLIVGPDGHVLAETKTHDDELLVATIDLADCRPQREGVFAFERHRQTQHYGRIVEQTGVVEPA